MRYHISNFEDNRKLPEMDLICYEKINYDYEEDNNNGNNFKESKEFMNVENLPTNKNNQRDYDESKYKLIEDKNFDNRGFGKDEQILINTENLFENIEDKVCNGGINCEDIK